MSDQLDSGVHIYVFYYVSVLILSRMFILKQKSILDIFLLLFWQFEIQYLDDNFRMVSSKDYFKKRNCFMFMTT